MRPAKRRFFIHSAVGLAVTAIWLTASVPALAVESVNYQGEIADLRPASAAIILGFIERQDIGVSETTAQVRVTRSFLGPLKEGESIQFKTGSGRVRVVRNQPDLTGVNQAVFFLTRDDADGAYRALKDNYGFKPVIHDKVYTNPQNPMETVKLKKYSEALAAAPQKA